MGGMSRRCRLCIFLRRVVDREDSNNNNNNNTIITITTISNIIRMEGEEDRYIILLR